MKAPRKLRCPYCRAHLDLEALVLDEASDALMQHIYRLPQGLRIALMPYLALFRADERDMTPERTLRLAMEVEGLEPDQTTLAAALSRTREAIVCKWKKSGRHALKDHAYLVPVIASVRAESVGRSPVPDEPSTGSMPTGSMPSSRTAQGVAALERMKIE